MTKNILLLLSAVIFTSACFAQQTNKNDELFRKAAVYIEAKRLPEAKDILSSISVKSRDDEFYMNLLNGQISLEQDKLVKIPSPPVSKSSISWSPPIYKSLPQ